MSASGQVLDRPEATAPGAKRAPASPPGSKLALGPGLPCGTGAASSPPWRSAPDRWRVATLRLLVLDNEKGRPRGGLRNGERLSAQRE